MNSIYALVSICIAQMAGIIGSVFTVSSVNGWYTTLVKSTLNPPSWVFGPAWVTLYTLMGLAAYLVWRKRHLPGAKLALTWYGVQLVLNALWSVLFFGLQQPGLAFAEIVALLACIVVTSVLFWRVSPLAGALMIPYIAWVAFASYLNVSIWLLNHAPVSTF